MLPDTFSELGVSIGVQCDIWSSADHGDDRPAKSSKNLFAHFSSTEDAKAHGAMVYKPVASKLTKRQPLSAILDTSHSAPLLKPASHDKKLTFAKDQLPFVGPLAGPGIASAIAAGKPRIQLGRDCGDASFNSAAPKQEAQADTTPEITAWEPVAPPAPILKLIRSPGGNKEEAKPRVPKPPPAKRTQLAPRPTALAATEEREESPLPEVREMPYVPSKYEELHLLEAKKKRAWIRRTDLLGNLPHGYDTTPGQHQRDGAVKLQTQFPGLQSTLRSRPLAGPRHPRGQAFDSEAQLPTKDHRVRRTERWLTTTVPPHHQI
eukprot:NODE_3165_length_1267_cov_48.710664_g3006_i0.p1 GENE.NODE_3165_length_1267_cov_48.710664_g3006_i0~~NODE_3165_length_1267_cov_48.710664_g3006_i0.p1  ORF type:complete len:320 (+),score=58.60 NODE_3165_length_1267_cov_48.710664_g3006_i0:189-1148(+)